MEHQQINIEERVARAKALFESGHNCSQSVFMAFSDLFGVDDRLAATIAAPLGGGVGRLREVCGAVTGMSLVVGLKYPSVDPKDKASRMKNYAVVRETAHAFEKQYGSVVCRELLKLRKGEEPELSASGHPILRAGACSCANLVESAARIVAEKLNEKQ